MPSIGDILRMYNIRAKKSLSQNFILDPRILDAIAKHSNVAGKHVVEVGPGPGGITRALMKAGAEKVYVVEKDRRFIPSLKLLQEASDGRLVVDIGDCLTYNVEKLVSKEANVPWESDELSNCVLVGNLPFNVATPFFLRLVAALDGRTNFYRFGKVPAILCFQEEVAVRMCSEPGDPNRCRLSAITQNYFEVDKLTTLPGGAFVPPPDVSVGLVRMIPHPSPFIKDLPFAFVNKVITGIFFSKKQKVMKSIERNLIPQGLRAEIVPVLAESLNIPDGRTVLELSMDEIARICYAYHHLCRVCKDMGVKTDFEGYRNPKGQIERHKEKEAVERFKRSQSEKFQKESRFDIQL